MARSWSSTQARHHQTRTERSPAGGEKTLKQVQGWARHSQLTTTLNTYIDQVDDGLGGGEVWEQAMPDLEGIRGRQHSQPAEDPTRSAACQPAR